MSVGELAMTRRISLVAVSCSSASGSWRLRAVKFLKQPHVFNGDDRLASECLEKFDLFISERSNFGSANKDRSESYALA